MRKTLVSNTLMLSVIIATSPASAIEADITSSGFVDFIWTLSDGTDQGKYGEDKQFHTTGELDLDTRFKQGISLRVDADVNPDYANGDSARLEQIYMNWDINKEASVKGGVFNNKLTFEKEDAPDLYQITHGQLWDIWNNSTAEDGNNLQGIEFSYQIEKVNIFVGFLNDLAGTVEKNSVEIAAEIGSAEDLDIKLGLITQDQNLETMIDLSASYKIKKLLLAGEILLPDQQIDNGFMLMANLQLNDKLSLTVRYDEVNYDNAFATDDTSSLTFAGIYNISNNLRTKAEVRLNDDNNAPTPAPLIGEGDGTTARLELLALF
jgi:hypothetical protein